MNETSLRIDKWLWAARFFKTRSLAAKAVDGGRVRVNGEGAKPSRLLKAGDELAIRVGELEWVVAVLALSRQRGPAAQAALLIPVHLKRGPIEARLFTTITTLGTPLDITLDELRIESYYPADEATARWMRGADVS